MSDNNASSSHSPSEEVLSKEEDEEGSLNIQQLFFGDAFQYIENEGGAEGLNKIEGLHKIDVNEERDQNQARQKQGLNPDEEEKFPHPNPEHVQKRSNYAVFKKPDQNMTKLDSNRKRPRTAAFNYDSDDANVGPDKWAQAEKLMNQLTLFRYKDEKNLETRVLQFTNLFMPDTKKRRDDMESYNKNVINPFVGFGGEYDREAKRRLKANYKLCMKKHAHKAKYLSVNMFMEDFFYLEGCSKQGTTKKAIQNPNYKPLFGQQQVTQLHQNIEKIVSKRKRKIGPDPHQFRQQTIKKQPDMPNDQVPSDMNGSTEANSERQFTLESCQINELQTKILQKEEKDHTELRNKFKEAKEAVSLSIRQKFPLAAFSPIEKQCYSFLHSMYTNAEMLKDKNMMRNDQDMYTLSFRNKDPDDYLLQEWVSQQKFNIAGIPQKRVKYWGELNNCSSEYQLLKDRIQIKRAEWQQFCKDKEGYKAPIFAFKTASPSQTLQNGQKGKDDKLKKDVPGQQNAIIAAQNAQAQVKGILKNAEQAVKTSKDKENELIKQQNPADIKAYEMVTNFEEYQRLRSHESKHYCQRKKTNVTAASIMRHVKWKIGQMSDKQFYREEYEEELASRVGQRSQRSIQQAKFNDVEFKDTESVKIVKDGPLEFEENFDTHFDRKRIEIQERILRMKEKKEKTNQQNQKLPTTTAYEPCLIKTVQNKPGESDEENRPNQGIGSSQEDEESSSSDSDSESDDGQDLHEKQKRKATRVLAAVGDELNHAKCIQDLSFYKLDWSKEDLDTFHRPNIQQSFFGTGSHLPMRVVNSKKDESEKRLNLNPHNYFKKRTKLSIKKGKFCVFEHIDQHPLFINNFGMASRLKRYFYGDKQPHKKVFKPNAENKETRHIGLLGDLVLKSRHDKLELLGQVDRKAYKGIAVLENKLYNVPVFAHKPHRVDFFCAIHKSEDNQNQAGAQSIFIRELEQIYTVGQIEPKLDVYNPQSRYFQNFIKQRSKSYVIRFLEEADNNTINFQDIVRYFPTIGEPILKKGLREIEVLVDRDGRCKFDKKFDIEKQKDRMTPEMICQYESARHGQHRLEKIGITEILSADKISYSTNKFCYEETDLTLQRVAKLIESEVLQTPWNLSTNFIKIKQELSMMMLQGQGDPSYGCGGYSFLKMPLKISADSLAGARQNRMNLNPAIQNPKAVTGTEADLRKLQKDDIYEKLVKLGVPREDLDRKTRWQMVALLRFYADEQDENKQYARGVRNTSKKQQEMYNERANQTFKKQMDNLSEYGIPKYTHPFSEDEPNFSNELHTRDYSTTPKKSKGIHGKSNKSKDTDSKREPGLNATDFAKDIHDLMNDQTQKLVVEVKESPQIQIGMKLEDIKDYLKLLLLRTPQSALAPQTQNPSGINIGGVSNNAEFLDAMCGNGGKDLEKVLYEKIQQREITKKCEILCKKIRSLTLMNNPDIDPEEKKKFQRIIFCADEKTIKKFKRCRNKNKDKQPRTNKKTRINDRVKSRSQLTAENLQKTSRANSKKGSSVTGSRIRDDDEESMLSNSRAQPSMKISIARNTSFSSAKKKTRKTQQQTNSHPKLKITNSGQQAQSIDNNGQLFEPQTGLTIAGGPQMVKIPMSTTPPASSFTRPKNSTTGGKGVKNSGFSSQFQKFTMSDDDDEDDQDNSESDFEWNRAQPLKKQQQRVMFAQEPPSIIRKKSTGNKLKRTNSNAARFKSHGFSNNDFEFSNSYQNKSSRKRQQASDQALNQIFSDIIQSLWDRDQRGWFHNQVSRQECPNYKDKIKFPIALKDMKNKTKRNEYKNRQQFLNDVALMRQNAETFNGLENLIAQIARELEELAKSEVDKKQDEIVNLETLVQETSSSALII